MSYAEGPPSEELANALTMHGSLAPTAWNASRRPRTCVDRAIEVASAVPVPIVESVALQYRGWIQHRLGFLDEALTDFARRA